MSMTVNSAAKGPTQVSAGQFNNSVEIRSDTSDICADGPGGCKTWPPFATTFFRLGILFMCLSWIMSVCAVGGTYWAGFDAGTSRATLYRFDLTRLTWCTSLAFCDEFFEKGISMRSLAGTQDLYAASRLCFDVFLASLIAGMVCMVRLALLSCLRGLCCQDCCGECCPIIKLRVIQDPHHLTWTRLTALCYAAISVACFASLKSYTDAANVAFPRYLASWWQATRGTTTGGTPPTAWAFQDGYNCAVAGAIFNAGCATLFAACVYCTRELDGGSTLCGCGDGVSSDGPQGAGRGIVGYGQAPTPWGERPDASAGYGPYTVQTSPLSGGGGHSSESLPMPSQLQAGPGGINMGQVTMGVINTGNGTVQGMAVPAAALYSYPGATGSFPPQIYSAGGAQVISMTGPPLQMTIPGLTGPGMPGAGPGGTGFAFQGGAPIGFVGSPYGPQMQMAQLPLHAASLGPMGMQGGFFPGPGGVAQYAAYSYPGPAAAMGPQRAMQLETHSVASGSGVQQAQGQPQSQSQGQAYASPRLQATAPAPQPKTLH